eukprot:m.42972 g.42972  ORF g.42972 m.42972 type:complete len:310 (+) comp19269_c0_seq1:76-1005(+)
MKLTNCTILATCIVILLELVSSNAQFCVAPAPALSDTTLRLRSTATETFAVEARGVQVIAWTTDRTSIGVKVQAADRSGSWTLSGEANPDLSSPFTCVDAACTFHEGCQKVNIVVSCEKVPLFQYCDGFARVTYTPCTTPTPDNSCSLKGVTTDNCASRCGGSGFSTSNGGLVTCSCVQSGTTRLLCTDADAGAQPTPPPTPPPFTYNGNTYYYDDDNTFSSGGGTEDAASDTGMYIGIGVAGFVLVTCAGLVVGVVLCRNKRRRALEVAHSVNHNVNPTWHNQNDTKPDNDTTDIEITFADEELISET